MKKRYFKDWVSYSLIVIQVLLIVIVSGECEECDRAVEFAIKAPCVVLLLINHFMIARHTRFYQGEF